MKDVYIVDYLVHDSLGRNVASNYLNMPNTKGAQKITRYDTDKYPQVKCSKAFQMNFLENDYTTYHLVVDLVDEMIEKYGDEDGVIDWYAVHKGGDDYLRWNDDLRRMIDAFTDAIDISVDEILAYVNSEDYAVSTHTLEDIPEIMVGIAMNNNYGLRINSMFNEFYEDLRVREAFGGNFEVRI